MKKKVIQFIGSLYDGGAETLVKDYCLLIDKNLFEIKVCVIFAGKNTANYKILKENNIEIISLYKKRNIFTRAINKFLGKILNPIKLKRLFKKEKPDILHIHLASLKFFSPLAKKLKDKKLFYTCHSLPQVYFTGKQKIEFTSAKKLIKHNDLQLIALHEDMQNQLNQMFGVNNTVVIKNGINFSRFLNIAITKEQERESLGIPKDAFVVGHTGRFVASKNHLFLIDVFNQVVKTRDNAFLLLIGHGELEEAIREKISQLGLEDRCLILSHRKDVPELLKAMDVFVFPSQFEGLGIVMIEAQVSGLKCVASSAVPRQAFITDSAIPVGLDEPIERWSEIILDDKVKAEPSACFDDYDMNKEIKHLESLYLAERV